MRVPKASVIQEIKEIKTYVRNTIKNDLLHEGNEPGGGGGSELLLSGVAAMKSSEN